eukprot:57733-Prymnesium_polylepis.1
MSEASESRRRAALLASMDLCWLLLAYVERPRHDSPAELKGPSRLLMRYSGGLLYVPKDL